MDRQRWFKMTDDRRDKPAGEELPEQGLATQALVFHDMAQALEGLHLYLAHPLARETDFAAHHFQGAAFITAQTKAAGYHLALLVGQLIQPG